MIALLVSFKKGGSLLNLTWVLNEQWPLVNCVNDIGIDLYTVVLNIVIFLVNTKVY